MSDQLQDGERADAVAQATRAQRRHEPDLRRLGAIGIIGIGLDPTKPTWRQWWARCLIGDRARLGDITYRPTPLLAEGYRTADEAMGALVDLAAKPRADT